MSDKLKCAEVDVAQDLKRDAVVAAAVSLHECATTPDARATWSKRVKELRAAVRNYQAFASSVDPGPSNCARGNCPSPYVCHRVAHCFGSEADA